MISEKTINNSSENNSILFDAFNRKKALIGKKSVQSILLIQPVQIATDKIDIKIAKNKRYYMYPPYALGLINKILIDNNYTSQVLDLNHKVFSFIHDALELNEVNDSELNTVWKETLINELDSFKPDLVGISCTFTMNHESMLDICEYVKSYDESIVVVAGGVHVTNARQHVLRDSSHIDYLSLYESEESFIKFLDFMNGKLEPKDLYQVSTLVDGEYYELSTTLPPTGSSMDIAPTYGSIDVSNFTDLGEIGTFRYWRPKDSKGTPILANKGCRAKCSFCSVRNFNGKGVRTKSIETVIDEMKYFNDHFNINHFTWLDDDLFYDPDRTYRLYNSIVQSGLKITWDASNGVIVSAATSHPELLDAAEESGCIGMYFGIESGNEKILRDIHKPSGIKHYLKLGELMLKHPKIFTRGFLIIGFPHETLGQIQDTITVARKMSLDWYTIQLLTPLPSTEIYDQMVDFGLIEQDSLNIEGEGYTMFSVRESERQRKYEESNGLKSDQLMGLLSQDPEHVPSKKELSDLWFLVDYEINYRDIPTLANEAKIVKLRAFLEDVSDRMTRDNPLANYYLSILEEKLNNTENSSFRRELSKSYVEKSEHWRNRFDFLDLKVN